MDEYRLSEKGFQSARQTLEREGFISEDNDDILLKIAACEKYIDAFKDKVDRRQEMLIVFFYKMHLEGRRKIKV